MIFILKFLGGLKQLYINFKTGYKDTHNSGDRIMATMKNVKDWKKSWLKSEDLDALEDLLNNVDTLYEEIRQSIGRVLLSTEMVEIQEVIDHRIVDLESKVAA